MATRLPGPDASIVIPVYNNAALTKDCVDRVFATIGDVECEVVVVDNASTDETAEMLRSFGEALHVIRNDENMGFTIASNQGARAASGRHIVFLNNDTLPEEGWIEWLVRTADSDDDIGAVGSKLVYQDGVLQEAGGIIFSDGNGWNYGKGDDPNHPKYRFVREVDYCSAASLLVKRGVFERLGGFDEQYAPAYYEDADLCFGVRSLGMKVVYQPRSVVVHLEGRTAGTDLGSGLKEYQVINRPKFVQKWREALQHQYANDPRNVEKACYRGATKDILVAHPTLPAYDISGGDLRFHKVLMILKDLGARVTFIARGSSTRDRTKYIPDLEQAGVEVYPADPLHCGGGSEPHPVNLPAFLLARHPDVAVMSHFDTGLLYIDEIRMLSPETFIVVDTCDVHFLRELRQAELTGDPKQMQRGLDVRARELVTYCRADLCLTVTEDDKQVLLRELPHLKVALAPTIHDAIHDSPGFEGRDGIVFIGYFKHTPNVDAMRFFVDDVFPLVREKLPDVKLWIVGSHPSQEILDMACEDIEVTGYVPETRPYLDKCRVSIAPLRYGAGMKGKVGEAMQLGIPVVSTSIGTEGMGLQDGVNVLVADDAVGFAEAICRLHTERPLWENLVANARAHIDEMYSTRVVRTMLQSILGFDAADDEVKTA